MFCANCGADEQKTKTYCRHCGTWIGTAPPEERLSVMILFNLLSAVLSAAVSVLLYITNIGRPFAHWSTYVAATLCLSVAVYQSLSFIFALNLRKRLKQGKSNNLEVGPGRHYELPAGDISQFIRPESVTENTTELLEQKSR
jgi:hypothetical protein